MGEVSRAGMTVAVICFVCATCVASHPPSRAAFEIGDAQVVYESALLKSPKDVWGSSALDALTNIIWRTTGKPVAAYDESSAPSGISPVIYLGDTKASRAAGICADALAPHEFRMKVEPGVAYLVGASGVGTSFAVTEFLKRFAGYRFLTMNGDDPCEIDPSRVAYVCDIRKKRAFVHLVNGTHGYGGRCCESNGERFNWSMRLRNGFVGFAGSGLENNQDLGPRHAVSPVPGRCHTQFKYCPVEQYGDDHPEYYSAIDDKGNRARPLGDHSGQQLCFSNPDVYRICRDSLFRFVSDQVAKDPVNYPRIYDFSQQDNSRHLCHCPECMKIVARYDRKGGFKNGGDAGLQLEFVNRLAKEVREKYPEVMIRVFAYVSTEEPPQGIVPEDNVIIWLCDLYTLSDHQLPITHPFNRHRMELVRDWSKIARNVELWDYSLYDGTYASVVADCLQVFPDAIAADARFFHKMGIERIYLENHFRNQPFFELNTYLQMELFFDPSQNPDDLIDAYCKIYGAGEGKMRELIEFLRRIMAENPPKSPNDWHRRILPWRTDANFEHILKLALEAYSLADTVPARRRVASVAAGAIHELVFQYRARPEKAERLAKLLKYYRRFEAQALKIGWLKGADVEAERRVDNSFVELATLKFNSIPPELDGADSRDFIYFDHHMVFNKVHAKTVDDPLSECKTAVRWNASEVCRDAEPPFAALVVSNGKKPSHFKLSPPFGDGKYAWTKLGTVHLGQNGAFILEKGFSWNISTAYTQSDGADLDPNWFEIFLSSRLEGSATSQDEKQGLFCDRLLLRRVSPPQSENE